MSQRREIANCTGSKYFAPEIKIGIFLCLGVIDALLLTGKKVFAKKNNCHAMVVGIACTQTHPTYLQRRKVY